MESIFVTYDNGRDAQPVTLEVLTQGAGPLVVLIASLGRGATDFADLAGKLAEAGYRAASVNPRGIGNSTGPAAQTMADFATDIAQVVKALSPHAQPAVLIGHAFGNRVARATATYHPECVSSLILLACGGQVPIAPVAGKALRDVFDNSLSDEDHIAAVRTAFFAPGNDAAVWRDGWYPAVAQAQQLALHATPTESWVGGGTTPLFIIQADCDAIAPLANAEALQAAHPGRVSIATLLLAGHAMLPEQPEALANIVLERLRAIG